MSHPAQGLIGKSTDGFHVNHCDHCPRASGIGHFPPRKCRVSGQAAGRHTPIPASLWCVAAPPSSRLCAPSRLFLKSDCRKKINWSTVAKEADEIQWMNLNQSSIPTPATNCLLIQLVIANDFMPPPLNGKRPFLLNPNHHSPTSYNGTQEERW